MLEKHLVNNWQDFYLGIDREVALEGIFYKLWKLPPCSFELFSGISSHPAVFFSHNKSANSTFSHNKPAKRIGCTMALIGVVCGVLQGLLSESSFSAHLAPMACLAGGFKMLSRPGKHLRPPLLDA
jgi:hypothetical protein